MAAQHRLEGMRVLRALSRALDGATSVDEILAAAGALVPGLADACTARDDTGAHVAATGDEPPGARVLELPLIARGEGVGALRLARAPARDDWDEVDRLVADDSAARLAHALACERRADGHARTYDDFLATLSHELRSPLNVIVGWIELLRGDRLDAARRTQALEIVARNAQVQTRLIEDILEASRIVSGKLRLDVADCASTDLVPGAVDAMRPLAADQGVTLVARNDAPFLFRGDPVRLAQVVMNLVGNAIRYSGAGGRVEATLRRDGDEVVLTVADDGAGIEPALLPHVFDRFRQGERRRVGGSKGLGLGLFIVRHIVELHGGTVTAASPGKGQGATFTVRLPASR